MFFTVTDKKSDTESQEKRAFIHSKFYCYFPWSGDILQDNMKMALKNSRENPDEHAEDKEFPLVFSRVRIKPTSCNYDEENNFDRRRKTGKDKGTYFLSEFDLSCCSSWASKLKFTYPENSLLTVRNST